MKDLSYNATAYAQGQNREKENLLNGINRDGKGGFEFWAVHLQPQVSY